MALWLKVCGITSIEDAMLALDAGADALGVNFVPSSRRCVALSVGRAVSDAVRDRALLIAVVADLAPEELGEIRERTRIAWLQLHGNEPDSVLESALPNAYRAVRVASAADVARARGAPGDHVLTDAKVGGELGGTGTTFDWRLVSGLAQERRVILAGGLHAGNVADAIRVVNPFGVDVASGVEGPDPRRKDPERLRSFVRAAREARSSR